MDQPIIIYSDGSSRGNPGPGGYGVILMYGNHRKELSKGYRLTTNNRMELLGVIEGLKSIKSADKPVEIFTDSQYVVKAINEGWLQKWLRTDFAGGKKNKDLWKTYAALASKFRISFKWVKGHSTNPYNNRCDELATAAADGKDLDIDQGYEAEVNGRMFS
jgi:ribonuclease HI